eukprot:6214680-Pleurochrysis_carterae.AAC.2
MATGDAAPHTSSTSCTLSLLAATCSPLSSTAGPPGWCCSRRRGTECDGEGDRQLPPESPSRSCGTSMTALRAASSRGGRSPSPHPSSSPRRTRPVDPSGRAPLSAPGGRTTDIRQ